MVHSVILFYDAITYTGRFTDREADRRMDVQTDRQTDVQTDRQTYGCADRKTDRQIY